MCNVLVRVCAQQNRSSLCSLMWHKGSLMQGNLANKPKRVGPGPD